jgi:hypothetical protein
LQQGFETIQFDLPLVGPDGSKETDQKGSVGVSHEGYRVVARIEDCQLSNGSACGNNTGWQSYQVLDGSSTPTPFGGRTGGVDATATRSPGSGASNTDVTRGTFTSLSPNPNGMTLGSVNSVVLTVAGDGPVSATFELSYYFGQSSQAQFRFNGRLEGERSGDQITGTVALDSPAADALSSQFEFGGNRATWEADITATGVSGVVRLLDGSGLAIETRRTPAP